MKTLFTMRQLSLSLLMMFASGLAAAQATAASAVAEAKPVSNMDFTRAQIDAVLLPAHTRLAQASKSWVEESRAFCAAPDAARFAKLQANYVQVLTVWRTIEVAPLGPSAEPELGRVMEGESRSAEQILTLAAQTPATAMVDGQAAYEASKLPAWGIGMKALEALLYSDKPTERMQVLSAEKACAYVVWQTQVVAYQTEILRRAWQGLSRGAMYDLSYPRTYQTQYLNRLVEGARELGAAKVGLHQAPWQDQRSGATVAGLQANVAGLRGLLTGNQTGLGLDDLMLSRDDHRNWAKVEKALVALEAALPQQDKDLTPRRAKQLAKAGNQLADVLEKDIAPLLIIQIGKVK
jgi:predicted lipoprotein